MGVKVIFDCGPMKIWPAPDAGLLFHRTDAEPMVCTVNFSMFQVENQGRLPVITISPVTIPPTLTRYEPPMTWWVDACVGEGGNTCPKCKGSDDEVVRGVGCSVCKGTGFIGNRVRVELPRERCTFGWKVGNKILQYGHSQDEAKQLSARFPFGLWAEAIDAPVTLWLADGRVFKTDPNVPDSFVNFGDCRIKDPLFSPEADSLTTTKGNLVEVAPS